MRLLLFIFILPSFVLYGQNTVRVLPPNINRPSMNLFAPYVSGDGETMVYLTDYADDGHHTMYWTTRNGVAQWNDGKEINSLINRPTHNFRGGYSLNFDGDVLYFTSRKSGMGGYDLWYSELKNGDWTAPKNFGKPVNSTSNEGSPVLSPDGEYLYFMRCEAMSEYRGAGGCQIMVAHRSFDGWEEPQPLPTNINTGNSQTPRLLADGETLIFSSDQPGGKGGLDLYLTSKNSDGQWSDPIPYSFLNTEYNDVFVSVPAKGRYAFASVKGDRNFMLVEKLIPEQLRPARVMRVKGKVMDHSSGGALPAEVTIFNVTERSRELVLKTGKSGEFALVLKEGSDYDLSVTSITPGYTYFSKNYQLESIEGRDKEIMRIILTPLANATEISRYITFRPTTSQPDDFSDFEIRRLATLLKENPSLDLDILICQNKYREDTLQSDSDLTEIRTDTLWTLPADSLINNPMEAQYDMTYRDLDSVYFMSPDSNKLAFPLSYITIQCYFHNDRTSKQIEALRTAFLEKGIDKQRLHFTSSLIAYAAPGDILPTNESGTAAGEKEEYPAEDVSVIIQPARSTKNY